MSSSGGGVVNLGAFNMNGGEIKDNTAFTASGVGGGVYNNGKLVLSAMANAPNPTFDKVNMTIKGVTDKMEYSVDGGDIWNMSTGTTIKIDNNWFEGLSADASVMVLVRTAATNSKIYSKTSNPLNVTAPKSIDFSMLDFEISDILTYNPAKGTLTYLPKARLLAAFTAAYQNGG